MKNKVLVRWPELQDKNGDLTFKWYIFFSIRNPKTDKMERFRKFDGLHKCKSLQQRYALAEERKQYWTHKIKSGWSPWDENNSNVVYQDTLQYSHIARIYGNKRSSNKTFRFFSNQYINQVTGLSSSTISTYKSKLRIFSQWLEVHYGDDNDISSIDNQVILAFFLWIINDQKRSAVTINKYKQILSQVFDYAIKQKYIRANPVFNIPHASVSCDMAPRPVQEGDIKQFLKYIDKADPQVGLVIRFEFNCFIRPKEIKLMQIKWIDFVVGTITIPRHILKTRHDRVAVIPHNFLVWLREVHKLHTYPKQFYVIGNEYKPSAKPWGSDNTIRRRFNEVRKRLDMPLEYKLYSWKHSGNVRAERDNMPMVDRMFQNGHSSIKTTEIYTRNKIGRSGGSFSQFDSI